MPEIIVTARAIIIDNGAMLMTRLKPEHDFVCLPGGKLEVGETIEACMSRELIEETGVKPDVGSLLYVNQLINTNIHRVEFFFRINNPKSYLNFDPAAASHAGEIVEFIWGDPRTEKFHMLPAFIAERFDSIVANNFLSPTEILLSS